MLGSGGKFPSLPAAGGGMSIPGLLTAGGWGRSCLLGIGGVGGNLSWDVATEETPVGRPTAGGGKPGTVKGKPDKAGGKPDP